MKKIFAVILVLVPVFGYSQIASDIDTLYGDYDYERTYGNIPAAEQKAYNLIQATAALASMIHAIGVGNTSVAAAALADFNEIAESSNSLPTYNFDETTQSYMILDSLNVGDNGYVDSLISWEGVLAAIETYNILTTSDTSWMQSEISDSVQAAITQLEAYADAAVAAEVAGDSTWESVLVDTLWLYSNVGAAGIFTNTMIYPQIRSGGFDSWIFQGYDFVSAQSDGVQLTNTSANDIRILPNKADANTGYTWKNADRASVEAGGVEVVYFTELSTRGILEVLDSSRFTNGAVFLDSIYLNVLDDAEGNEQWLGLSATNGVFADSISAAGYGLGDELVPIKEYMSDRKNGEISYYHTDANRNKVKDYSETRNLREKLQHMQWANEHAFRYIEEQQKQIDLLSTEIQKLKNANRKHRHFKIFGRSKRDVLCREND